MNISIHFHKKEKKKINSKTQTYYETLDNIDSLVSARKNNSRRQMLDSPTGHFRGEAYVLSSEETSS